MKFSVEAVKQAQLLLREEKITRLPVNPYNIAKKRGWGPVFYLHRTSLKSYVRRGFINEATNKIYINEIARNEEEKRWTGAHELGHMVCHKGKYTPQELWDPRIRGKLEREANDFAAELLAPIALLKLLGITRCYDIAYICEISLRAAKRREREIEEWGHLPVFMDAQSWMRSQFGEYLEEMFDLWSKKRSWRII